MQKIDVLLEQLGKSAEKDRIVVNEGEELFQVNIVTSAVALFYEKVRTFIDYNEEHLLRKNAIFRILKRRFIEQSKVTKISENIVKELILAGYLPNNKLPVSMKLTIAEIITKYQLLFDEIQERKGFFKGAVKLYQWLLNLAAVEIEERLAPYSQEKVYITFLFNECKKRFEIEYPEYDEKTRELYLYVAVNRSLIKSDRQMLNYLLLKTLYPSWKDNYEDLIPYLAENIDEVREQLEEPIDNKLTNKLYRKVSRYASMVNNLRLVFSSPEFEPGQAGDQDYLQEQIKKVTLQRYKTVRSKLGTSMGRAIIYVFLTKMCLALLIEVPIDKYLYGEFHVMSLFINITVPVILMILIAITIKTPGEKNTEAMISGVMEMLSPAPVKIEYVRAAKKRSLFTKVLFNIIYVIAFLIPFYLIIKVLNLLNFSVLSIILILVFVSIVSFFGVRVRGYAKDIDVLPKKESLRTEVFEFFTNPIVRFGRWLSLNFSKVNIFAIFMDIIIEAPLKLVLQVLDEWFGFVKEKGGDY